MDWFPAINAGLAFIAILLLLVSVGSSIATSLRNKRFENTEKKRSAKLNPKLNALRVKRSRRAGEAGRARPMGPIIQRIISEELLSIRLEKNAKLKVIFVVRFLHFCSNMVYHLNFPFIKAVTKLFWATSSDAKESNGKTIVGIMLIEKMKKTMKARIYLASGAIISIIAGNLFDFSNANTVIFVCMVLYLAIELDNAIIASRVKRGVYGANEFEAVEILTFISRHSNKGDFGDDDGVKKLMPAADQEDRYATSHNAIDA